MNKKVCCLQWELNLLHQHLSILIPIPIHLCVLRENSTGPVTMQCIILLNQWWSVVSWIPNGDDFNFCFFLKPLDVNFVQKYQICVFAKTSSVMVKWTVKTSKYFKFNKTVNYNWKGTNLFKYYVTKYNYFHILKIV